MATFLIRLRAYELLALSAHPHHTISTAVSRGRRRQNSTTRGNQPGSFTAYCFWTNCRNSERCKGGSATTAGRRGCHHIPFQWHCFISSFIYLIGSANPCPCGFSVIKQGNAFVPPLQISRYLGKISGPLMDRFDIQIEVLQFPLKS